MYLENGPAGGMTTSAYTTDVTTGVMTHALPLIPPKEGARKYAISRIQVANFVGDAAFYIQPFATAAGTINGIGNYSSAAVDFIIEPAATEEIHINHINVQITDAGNAEVEEYGSIGTALANGVRLYYYDGSSENAIDAGLPIKSNGDYARLVFDTRIENPTAGSNCQISARIPFDGVINSSDGYLHLEGHAGHKLIVRLNDDLTGLITHYFIADGTTHTQNDLIITSGSTEIYTNEMILKNTVIAFDPLLVCGEGEAVTITLGPGVTSGTLLVNYTTVP